MGLALCRVIWRDVLLELFSGVVLWVLWVWMQVWLSMDGGSGKDGGEIESDTTL
jgi:hypothetical protein